LGAVLYELLSGALPFDSSALRDTGLAEALRIVREEEPPRLPARFRQLGEATVEIARNRQCSATQLERHLSRDLDAILQTALSKDPRRRYASAADFALDLGRICATKRYGLTNPMFGIAQASSSGGAAELSRWLFQPLPSS
jgi:serine/threonine protein kinase